jgi:hypothetical protein
LRDSHSLAFRRRRERWKEGSLRKILHVLGIGYCYLTFRPPGRFVTRAGISVKFPDIYAKYGNRERRSATHTTRTWSRTMRGDAGQAEYAVCSPRSFLLLDTHGGPACALARGEALLPLQHPRRNGVHPKLRHPWSCKSRPGDGRLRACQCWGLPATTFLHCRWVVMKRYEEGGTRVSLC